MRGRQVALGVALGVSLFVTCNLAFGAALLNCRAENQNHHPAACSLSDQHPGMLFFTSLGLSLGVIGLGLLRLDRRVLLTVAGAIAAAYLAYALAVYAT